jgi:hypothetical protein
MDERQGTNCSYQSKLLNLIIEVHKKEALITIHEIDQIKISVPEPITVDRSLLPDFRLL